MLEGDQWNEVVHPPALPPPLGGNQTEVPIFHIGTLRLPGVAEVTKFPHQAFFSGTRTSSLEPRVLGRVTQKAKG